MSITCPSVFFALWTICRISHQVGDIRLVGCSENFVQQFAATLNHSNFRYVTVYKIGHHVIGSEGYRCTGCYLHIPKTLIAELGRKSIVTTTQRQDVCLERFSLFVATIVHVDIVHIECTVCLQPLAMLDAHHGSLKALDTGMRYTRHILSKVIYVCGIVYLLTTNSIDSLHQSDGLHVLANDF